MFFYKDFLKNLCHPYSKLTSLICVATEVSIPVTPICILCTKVSQYQDPTKKKIPMAGVFTLHFTLVIMLSASARPAAGLLYHENQGRFCVLGESGPVFCISVTSVMNDTSTYVDFKRGTTLYITKRCRRHFK